MRLLRRFGIVVLFVCVAFGLFAEDIDNIRITQKFDLRRKINNQYVGLFYGYEQGVWKLTPSTEGKTQVDAHYYLMTESMRDTSVVEKPLQAEKSVSFTLTADGKMSNFQGDSVPYYRNYPERPPKDAQPGTVWVGTGELVSDFLGSGKATRIPILIEYKWKGEALLGDRPVWQVIAKYAIRYKRGQDPTGDLDLDKAEGTHDAAISLDKQTLQPIFLRETVKEAFFSSAGKTVTNEGIIFTFYDGVPPLNKGEETHRLVDELAKDKVDDVKVQEDPRGVKLTLENLRFVADQAVLLPGEDQRLDRIAELLKSVKDRSFLIIGHTADFGSKESQVTLSNQRAVSIVEALKKRGVEARKLIYDGRGGREPIAPNDTEAGRAQNRRVEIIVLDQ